MNTWRRRLALWLAFLITGTAFDMATDGMPSAPLFWLLYYGGAATVDLFMFRITRFFVSKNLERDVEAICIASAAVNALGWALKMAEIPPDFYNSLIAGLNYVLALRLLLGDGNVFNGINHCYRRIVVLCHLSGYKNHPPEKEK